MKFSEKFIEGLSDFIRIHELLRDLDDLIKKNENFQMKYTLNIEKTLLGFQTEQSHGKSKEKGRMYIYMYVCTSSYSTLKMSHKKKSTVGKVFIDLFGKVMGKLQEFVLFSFA